jgi:hypothetical protein
MFFWYNRIKVIYLQTMKRTVKFFFHKLGSVYNTEFILIPTIEYHYYPTGNFIEQGVYSWKHVIEFKFLFWGAGATYFIDYDEYYDKIIEEIGSDEPLEYDRQITSIPEKQIKDEE